ncbi:MAG: putative peptidase [Firmicutes bacterium]|nr:putative peptidase [candidate division NPL-UPA2 bacterium]MBT9153529.1 putative peptidase [candidate division NPL-UPA2 bacterium]
MQSNRIETLAENLRGRNICAAAVLPSAGLFYLTGMAASLSERPLLFVFPAAGEVSAVCPAFEAERVRRDSGVHNLFTYTDEENAGAGFERLARHIGKINLLAMEFQAARVLEYKLLQDSCGVKQLTDLRPILSLQRMRKEPAEINKLQQAAQMADAAMAVVEQKLALGVTELQIAEAAENFVKTRGGRMSFVSIIAGERTALPHASTSTRPLRAGDAVVADLGCLVDGYTSDITRTFLLGDASAELLKIGAVVFEANRLAREAVGVDVEAGHIDSVARSCISLAGYGQFFTHRTGHGLGLEVHEEPYIVGGSLEKLQVGHTFTIEPGIYLPGIGGVRIEDDVCVTATGALSLTTYPRAVKVVKLLCSTD